jgi:hypothetical protein
LVPAAQETGGPRKEGGKKLAKKLIVGQAEWIIPDQDASDVVKQVRNAVTNTAPVELQLLDSLRKPVTVFLNAQAAPTVVVDLDEDPRPSEMS